MLEILSTFAFGHIGDIEVTILGISERCLKFSYSSNLEKKYFQIQLELYNPEEMKYEHLSIQVERIRHIKKLFENEYTVLIQEISNDALYVKILKLYENIICKRNKNHELQKLTSYDEIYRLYPAYPYEKDRYKYHNYDEMLVEWFFNEKYSGEYVKRFNQLTYDVEFALFINNDADYNKVLSCNIEEFCKQKYKKNMLQNHPISQRKVTRYYVGNEYCPNLFPKRTVFEKILNILLEQKCNITICYPFLQESRLEEVDAIFDSIDKVVNKEVNVEFVINDWGMLHYIKNKKINITPILGHLLNKRKKDPRILYWVGYDSTHNNNKVNGVNVNNNIDFLNEMDLKRFEFEDYSQLIQIPKGNHSIYTPYFQINTSTFCNLYADVKNKVSNNVLECPQYCEKIYYSYPQHLKMIGLGNSILGYNADSVLFNLDRLEYYVSHNIDRIVLTI